MLSRPAGHALDDEFLARPRKLLAGLEDVPLLLTIGDVQVGWLLLQRAEIARNALGRDPVPHDRALYTGKVTITTFFAKTMAAAGTRRWIVGAADLTVMNMPGDAY